MGATQKAEQTMGSGASSPANGARERLIKSHLPLVQALARRYAGRGEPLDDLVQAGSVGLIKASDRFDPSRGVTFGSFAAPVIEGEIRRHLRDRSGALRIPRDLQRMSGELRRCHETLAATLGRAPTVPELAAELSAQEDDVQRALAADRARNTTTITPGGEAAELADEADPHGDSENRVLVAMGARVLDERERRIVLLRFHADMTEREIASEIGISQAHVSRLLDGALSKLRAELVENGGDTTPPEAIPKAPAAKIGRQKRAGASETAAENGSGTGSNRTQTDNRIARVGVPQEKKASRNAEKAGASSTHSGRFLVRMPSTLHEDLARAAKREHVSLNRFVTDVLAASVSSARPIDAPTDASPPADPAPGPLGRSTRGLRLALATNLVVVVLAGVLAVALLVLALERGI